MPDEIKASVTEVATIKAVNAAVFALAAASAPEQSDRFIFTIARPTKANPIEGFPDETMSVSVRFLRSKDGQEWFDTGGGFTFDGGMAEDENGEHAFTGFSCPIKEDGLQVRPEIAIYHKKSGELIDPAKFNLALDTKTTFLVPEGGRTPKPKVTNSVGLIDNDEAEVASGTSGTTPSTTISGSNTCAAVGVRLSDLSTPTTVKWGGSGGTTMTRVTSPVTVDWWQLVAATTGAGYASWSGNKAAHIVSQTMDNVDQSSPIQDSDHFSVTDTSATNGTDITAAASVTMTSTAGSAALGIAYASYVSAGSLSGEALAVSGSLTQRQSYDVGTGKMSFGNYTAAGSSVTVGFSGTGSVAYDDGSSITVDADFVVFKEASGGGGDITGTAAFTEGADTLAASGAITTTGTIAFTEGNDTAAISGAITVTGTVAFTEAADTIVASGLVQWIAALASTEEDDTLAASGTVIVTGTLSVTEEDDTAEGEGQVYITGTLIFTEEDDTLVAAGTIVSGITGAIVFTEEADTAEASGTTESSGTVVFTEEDDTLIATGNNGAVISVTIRRRKARIAPQHKLMW